MDLILEYLCIQFKTMRKNPETSLQAYERITQQVRDTTYKKIIDALKKIGKGNYELIAAAAFEKESRIWKRLGELRNMGVIIDTGERTLTKDNNNSMVYALFSDAEKYKDIPKPERVESITAVDFANLLIAKGNRVQQKSLF